MSPLHRQTTNVPDIRAILYRGVQIRPDLALQPLSYPAPVGLPEPGETTARVRHRPEGAVILVDTGRANQTSLGDGPTQEQGGGLWGAILQVAREQIQESVNDTRGESEPDYTELRGTLEELQDVRQEAIEEEEQMPSHAAFTNAERMIRVMYEMVSHSYMVELFPEGAIAITVPGGFRRSVMVVCESDGSVQCSVNVNGEGRSARYTQPNTLPDGFLRAALNDLETEQEGIYRIGG